MLGSLKLWGLRRKLRSSIPRDPLTTMDPGPWLDAAGSMMHLRATCPEPNWLVHCAYWAGVPQDQILAATLAQCQHVKSLAPAVFGELEDVELRRASYPLLADIILAIEKQHPAIRGIDAYFPSPYSLSSNLGSKRSHHIEADALVGQNAIAAGHVLMIVGVAHRDRGAREALALTCGGAATLLALGAPNERAKLLDLQRSTYGWDSSMTSAAFVK